MKKSIRKVLMGIVFVSSILSVSVGVGALNTANADMGTIFMKDGASIRYSNPSGIRFTGYVAENVYTENSVVGMKITVNGVEKDFSTATIEGATWQWTESDVDGYKKFNVAITGIPEIQYATEMTAQAYVDQTVSAEIVTRSIANVATAALAENALKVELAAENVLDDTRVTALEGYLSTTEILSAVDLSTVEVEDANFVWDAVANAKGYFVACDDVIVKVNEATVALSEFGELAEEVELSIIAYGDGKTATYSEVVTDTVSTKEEFNPTLATFDDANCGTVSNVPAKLNGYRLEPTYTNDGTVKVGVLFDNYAQDANTTYLAAFKVTLPKGLNLSMGGIVVRAQLYDWSNVGTYTYFTMLSNNGQATWQSSGATSFPNVKLTKSEWLTLTVSSYTLQKLGYVNGATELYFGGWMNTTTSGYAGGPGQWWELDDISYYAPTESLELASFDNENCGTVSNVPAKYNYYRLEPTYTGEGTVKTGIIFDCYDGGASTSLAAFKVTLPKGLDLSMDGITIRIKFYDWSNIGTYTYFTMLSNNGQASWQSSGVTAFPKVSLVKGEWLTLTVSSATLETLGYEDGATVLYFGGWINNTTAPYSPGAPGQWYEIDYVNYYKEN